MDSVNAQKSYKRYRMQTFIAAPLGYALCYVCRLSVLDLCHRKLVNGFLADGANMGAPVGIMALSLPSISL